MHAVSATVHPVYALVGPDRFLRHDALAKILDGLADETDALGPARFDGSRAALAEVLDEVRTPSLLGSRRVAVVDEADSFITAHRAALERYCTAPSNGGSLILMCNSLPKNTRLYKIMVTTGTVLHADPPKGRAVIGWLVNRARTVYGRSLGQQSAKMLHDHLGNSLGVLDAELSKLAVYIGDRNEITPADIERLTGRYREEKVFAVTDAMAAHNPAAALAHWEQVLATDRAAPGRAVAGLAWGVRRLLEARRDWEAGTSMRELARRMYTDPNLLQQRLERVTAEQLERQQSDLLAADLAIKTGVSTVEGVVAGFIVKHSTGFGESRVGATG